MSYPGFEWKRKTFPVRLTRHARLRMFEYGLRQYFIDAIVREGKVISHVSGSPRKLCLTQYDGKTNHSTVVIAIIERNHIKVITTWQKKGR